jgi:hypothetical protein
MENDIIYGFENEYGITLHITGVSPLTNEDGEHYTTMNVINFEPEDELFGWAIQQLESLNQGE